MCVYIFTFLRILMNAKRHGKKEINKYGRRKKKKKERRKKKKKKKRKKEEEEESKLDILNGSLG